MTPSACDTCCGCTDDLPENKENIARCMAAAALERGEAEIA